ncbi:MAG TPA: hypothetical protein VGV38_04505, partial [Pyrinomonadaceae bacterium]|nr:hypothetical protein [Pyrinomonadaceae bacterium]
LGVPRYFYGRAARAALSRARSVFGARSDESKKFSNELALLDLAGYFYGKHFYKTTPARTNGAQPLAGQAAQTAGEKTA